MKQNQTADIRNCQQQNAACLACELCRAIHFEEGRGKQPTPLIEDKGLYAAEAQTYQFYFLPACNCA